MDTGGFEFSDLVAPHPRDQTQVIVVAPLAFAVVFPWTDAAMLALERIFLRPADLTKFGAFGETQKNRLQMAVVREVIVQPKPLLFAVAENDVAQFGHPPLQAFEMLAVVAELDQVVGLAVRPSLVSMTS